MKNIIKTSGLALLATLLSFAMYSCSQSQTPGEVVSAYFHQLQKGHLKKAYSYTCWDSKEIEDTIDKLEGIDIKIKKYEILSETIDDSGESATVGVRYTYGSTFDDGETVENTVEEEINLYLVNGQWKIG